MVILNIMKINFFNFQLLIVTHELIAYYNTGHSQLTWANILLFRQRLPTFATFAQRSRQFRRFSPTVPAVVLTFADETLANIGELGRNSRERRRTSAKLPRTSANFGETTANVGEKKECSPR